MAPESRLGKIEAYVKDQFDYKKHFVSSEQQIGSKEVSQSFNKNKVEAVQKVNGRSGKQQRLRELAFDEKLSSVDRGWIQQELNSIDRKSTRISNLGDLKLQKNIRVPPRKELAHRRGKAAKDGYGYEYSDLQDIDLHKLQHKHEGYK